MSFLSFFRKSQNISSIPLSGIIAPNMGRRKGLNLYVCCDEGITTSYVGLSLDNTGSAIFHSLC